MAIVWGVPNFRIFTVLYLQIVNKGYPNQGIIYGYTLPRGSDTVGSLNLPPKIQNIRLKGDFEKTPTGPGISEVDQYWEPLRKPGKSTNIQIGSTKVRVSPSRPDSREVIVPGTRYGVDSPDFSYLHGNSQRYSWSYGHWAPCSNGCGMGKWKWDVLSNCPKNA